MITLVREAAFIDPAVSDVATLLSGLRPQVDAFLLDHATPARRRLRALWHRALRRRPPMRLSARCRQAGCLEYPRLSAALTPCRVRNARKAQVEVTP